MEKDFVIKSSSNMVIFRWKEGGNGLENIQALCAVGH